MAYFYEDVEIVLSKSFDIAAEMSLPLVLATVTFASLVTGNSQFPDCVNGPVSKFKILLDLNLHSQISAGKQYGL